VQAAGRAGVAGISCEVRAPARLIAGIDPDRIGEAAGNLADGALQFAPGRTSIVLAARAAGATWSSRSQATVLASRRNACRTPSSGSAAWTPSVRAAMADRPGAGHCRRHRVRSPRTGLG